MKKLLAVVFLIMIVSGVFAGGVSEDKGIVLEYWAYKGYDGQEQDIQTICDEFYDKYGIKVEFQLLSWADIGGKVQAALLAGQAPDVLRDYSGRLGSYANQGYAVPLDDLASGDYGKNLNKSIMEMGVIDGHQLYMPTEVTAYCMMVNKTIFEKAGALNYLPSNAERSWTRKEFEAALAAVKDEQQGIYGTALFAKDQSGDTVTKLLIEGGHQTYLYSDGYKKLNYNSAGALEGLEWLKSLIDKGLVYPGAASLHSDDTWGLFQESKIAILGDNTEMKAWAMENIKSGTMAPSEFMFVQFPHKDGDKPKSTSAPRGMILFDNGDSARIDAGKKFIEFFSLHPLLTKGLKLGGNHSVLAKDPGMYKDDSEMQWIQEYIIPNSVPWGLSSKGYGEIRMALYPEVQAVYAGTKTPRQALADFMKRGQEILDEVNK